MAQDQLVGAPEGEIGPAEKATGGRNGWNDFFVTPGKPNLPPRLSN